MHKWDRDLEHQDLKSLSSRKSSSHCEASERSVTQSSRPQSYLWDIERPFPRFFMTHWRAGGDPSSSFLRPQIGKCNSISLWRHASHFYHWGANDRGEKKRIIRRRIILIKSFFFAEFNPCLAKWSRHPWTRVQKKDGEIWEKNIVEANSMQNGKKRCAEDNFHFRARTWLILVRILNIVYNTRTDTI